MLAVVLRKANRFRRQPLFIQLWFMPAWLLLGISKALIFTVQFQKLAKLLGCSTEPVAWVPLLSVEQESRALMIGRAVRLAVAYTPWDSNCFPQAVAARCLLGLYGVPYAMFFGLRRDPATQDMKAHAWVAAGKIRVTGGMGFGHYTVVGCFVPNALNPR